MKEEIVQSPATGVHRKLRKTGILAIGDVPWGTHFCQFYQTKEDLLNILVPYFKAGLGNNESCMWVTSEPLTLEEAKEAMRKAVPEFDRCLERGQIEIIPHTEWYLKDGAFSQKRVLNGWIDKLNEALAKGYDGLRLTGNTFWLERKDWRDFANYEEEVNSVIGKYRMIAICTYSLDKCSASEVIDVVRNHQFALIKRIGKWELIESSEIKRMKEALIRSEGMFEDVLAASPEAITTSDLNGNIVDCNQAKLDIHGFSSKEELIGKSVFEVIAEKDRQRAVENLKKTIEQETVRNIEYAFLTKDGREFPGELSASVIKDPSGNLTGIVGITKDITERKKAEEALRESEEKYRTQFEEALDAIVVADAETGVIIDCNRAASELVGREKSELVGKHQRILHPPEEIEGEFSRTYKQHLKEKEGQILETQVITKRGEIKEVAIKANIFELGDKKVLQGLFRDITERKKAELALRESEEKYRNLVENSKDSIVIIDLKGNVQFANTATEELTGYTHEEGLGINVRKTTPLRYWPKSLAMLLRARKGEQIPYFESMIKRKDGRLIPVESGGQAIFKDGKVIGIQIITRDISERRMAEEKIRESEEKYRSLFELAPDSIMAFDLKGVVTSCNTTATIMSGYSKDELVGKHFSKIVAVPTRDVPKYLKIFTSVLRGKIPKPFEVVWKDKNGTPHFGEVQCSLMKEKGKLVGTQVIMRDITERKKADEALRASLERYRSFIEVTGELGWTTNADGEVLEDIPSFRNFTGQTYEEVKGWGWSKALHPDDLERTTRIWKEANRTKSKYEIEYRLRNHDGVYRYFMARGVPVLKEDGSIREWVGTCIDITERKKAEEALREEEQRFRDIVTSTGDWIWETDPEGKYTYVSPMVEQLLGYKPEEVLGKYFHDFFVPEEKEQLKEAAFNVFSDRGRFRGFVNRNIHKNGEIVFLETSGVPIFDNDGQFLGYRGTDHNVTESKIMEEHLSVLNFYGGMLSSAKSLPQIYELTLDAMQQLLGSEYFTFATIDRGILRSIHQRGYPEPTNFELPLDGTKKGITVKVAQTWASVLAYDVSENKDYVELTNGIRSELAVPIVVDEKVVGVLNAESKKLGAFNQKHEVMLQVLAWNVATAMSNVMNLEEIERYSQQLEKLVKKRTDQLEEAQAQLVKSERLAAIGELASMVGHDLRNPLQAIENAAYYLNSELSNLSASVPISQKTTEMLKVINDSINHADKIILDLQDFSATKKPVLEKTDINAIVKETMSQFPIPKNVKLISELDRLPEIKADKNQMKRVFLNLTSNALQAMENGGTLTVSTKRANGFVEVSFKDTGAGIAKENIEKLFNPFFTTRAQGMGMGLPICKKFIESHGGSIEIETEEGKGSTFIVKLPLPRENGGENP